MNVPPYHLTATTDTTKCALSVEIESHRFPIFESIFHLQAKGISNSHIVNKAIEQEEGGWRSLIDHPSKMRTLSIVVDKLENMGCVRTGLSPKIVWCDDRLTTANLCL
jgi:hypothetical protein